MATVSVFMTISFSLLSEAGVDGIECTSLRLLTVTNAALIKAHIVSVCPYHSCLHLKAFDLESSFFDAHVSSEYVGQF